MSIVWDSLPGKSYFGSSVEGTKDAVTHSPLGPSLVHNVCPYVEVKWRE